MTDILTRIIDEKPIRAEILRARSDGAGAPQPRRCGSLRKLMRLV